MMDEGLGVVIILALILIFVGLLISFIIEIRYGKIRKVRAVWLIIGGLVWLWVLRREVGVWSLIGWLGVLVSIAGLLVYIEAVKSDIIKALGGPLQGKNEGE